MGSKVLLSLRKLTITSVNLFTEASLINIISSCVVLSELDISNTSGLSENGFRKIIDSCQGLTVLQLNRVHKVTGDDIKYALDNLKSLLSLRLKYLSIQTFSDDENNTLFENSQLSLTELDVTCCKYV